MRWTAKASLFAGVATIAVSIGFVPQPTNFPSSTIYDAVPVQLGSVAHAQARLSVGVFFDRLQPHGRWVRHRAHGLVFVPAGVGRDWLPIPTKPPLCSNLIAPPDSEMISPPGAGALLAV